MTNYQKRKEKNDEYRSRIKRFTLQFSLGDGEAREWFEQQSEQGVYLKGLSPAAITPQAAASSQRFTARSCAYGT